MNNRGVTRQILAAINSRMLCGEAELPSDDGLPWGKVKSYASVDENTALMAFDTVARDPGNFSLMTKEGSLIDFMFERDRLMEKVVRVFSRKKTTVTIWISFGGDLPTRFEDNHVLSIEEARKLISLVYSDLAEGLIWRRIKLPRISASENESSA